MSRADARLRRDLADLDRELASFAGEAQQWDDVCRRCDGRMYGRGAGACRCRCGDCGRRYWSECTCRAEDFAAAPGRRRAANPAPAQSKGHLAWLDGKTKEAFVQAGEVYIAPANTPLDINGCRQGARWECSKKAWDRYFDALFKQRIEGNPSRREVYYAGDDRFDHVAPVPGATLWTTSGESGHLERVRLVGRRPERDFDQKHAWEWTWLTGPEAGSTGIGYGRSFWRRKQRTVANPSRRDRDFARRQTALPGLAETGFSLTPQQDALARRREIAREEREAARREAEFKARQAAMFGDGVPDTAPERDEPDA